MSTDAVKARASAVVEVAHALASYGRSASTVLSSARSDLTRAHAEFQLVVADSQRRLLAAERAVDIAAAELARCENGCGGLETALARSRVAQQEAQRCVDRNRQAQARFDRAAADLSSSLRTFETSTNDLVPSGRDFVREYAEILNRYLKTGVSG